MSYNSKDFGWKDREGREKIIYDLLADYSKNDNARIVLNGIVDKYIFDFNALNTIINCCNSVKCNDILDRIVDYSLNYIINHYSGDYEKVDETYYFESLLQSIVFSAYQRRNHEFFERHKDSKVGLFRAYICGGTDTPEYYLNDSTELVKEIALARTGIDEKIQTRTPNEQRFIQMLSELFDKGEIFLESYPLYYDSPVTGATYKNHNFIIFGGIVDSESIYFPDRYIIINIQDNRVIAERMLDYVKNYKILFKAIPEGYEDLFRDFNIAPEISIGQMLYNINQTLANHGKKRFENVNDAFAPLHEYYSNNDFLPSIYLVKQEDGSFISKIIDNDFNCRGHLKIDSNNGTISIVPLNSKTTNDENTDDSEFIIFNDRAYSDGIPPKK